MLWKIHCMGLAQGTHLKGKIVFQFKECRSLPSNVAQVEH